MKILPNETALATLLHLQKKQQSHYYETHSLTPQEHQQWTDELLLGLYEEVGELARGIRTKVHITQDDPFHSNIVEEIVDVLKYTLAIADLNNVTAEQLSKSFKAKTSVVSSRFKQSDLDVSNQKVLVTDLDGCVADIQPFVEQFGAYGKTIGGIETERAKSSWYEQGGFLDLERISGAKNALLKAKSEGYLIALITARPVWQHRRVRLDTVKWLEDNGIPYDILVFDKDKYDALIKHVFPAKVALFVEDRDKHAIELAAHGVPVALINKEYNKTLQQNKYITRVDTWDEIYNIAIQNGDQLTTNS